tara:strand:+ start:166 stop:1380 length:1215 start_codon:yes stop_codon:yes gene_type:complete
MIEIKRSTHDIIICGGGMIGAATALQLASSGVRVALIESASAVKFLPSQPFDLRVSALSPQTVSLLNSIGAWKYVLKKRCCPYRRLRVWEKSGFGNVTFHAHEINREELGFIVENRIVRIALWEQILDTAEIDVYWPARFDKFEYLNNLIKVTLDDGNQLSAKLLIGADGANSAIRQALQIKTSRYDYHQSCLVASVRAPSATKDITWQRFLKTGPQAFLPTSPLDASLVWYHDPEFISDLAEQDNAALAQKIMYAFPKELGEIRVLSKGKFQLFKQHARSYVGRGVVLIGDAAHTINPLAGQGLNLGFQDSACLSQGIKMAMFQGKDWWSEEVLNRYQSQRRVINSIMMHAMDALYYGFSNDFGPLKFARNSLLSLAKFPILSKPILRYATGLDLISKKEHLQ